MLQQPGHQLVKLVLAFEHDVGGVLGLSGDPVVGHRCEKILEGWVDHSSVAMEPRDPVQADESIGEVLGPMEVFEPQEGVVLLGEPDAVTGELAGQPFVPIEVDLELQGKPGLDADVDQAEGP